VAGNSFVICQKGFVFNPSPCDFIGRKRRGCINRRKEGASVRTSRAQEASRRNSHLACKLSDSTIPIEPATKGTARDRALLHAQAKTARAPTTTHLYFWRHTSASHAHGRRPSNCIRWMRQAGSIATCAIPDLLL
jgi:hypothetical protein